MQMLFCFHTITAKQRICYTSGLLHPGSTTRNICNTQVVAATVLITKSMKTEGINKSMKPYI